AIDRADARRSVRWRRQAEYVVASDTWPCSLCRSIGRRRLCPVQGVPALDHLWRSPDLRLRCLIVVGLFALGNLRLRQREGLHDIRRFLQRLGKQRSAEIGEVVLLRTAERHPIGSRGRNDQSPGILHRFDEAARVAGGDDDHQVALGQWLEQACQLAGGQIFQRQAWLLQGQAVIGRAVAGEVHEQQVFRAAAFGQCLDGPCQVLAGGQRPVSEVVAMVDQADLAVGGKALGQQPRDVVGLTEEHALLAVTGKGQAVQLGGRGRSGQGGDGPVEQRALFQQGDLQRVRQRLAIFVVGAPALVPGATLQGAIAQGQLPLPIETTLPELAHIAATIGEVQAALAVIAPVLEPAAAVAAVAVHVLASASQPAFLEAADPGIAFGILVAALDMKLIVLEQAAVPRAIMPGARARTFEQTAFEVAAVLSLGVATGAFALRQALDELAVVDDSIFLPQGAVTVIEAVAKCALVAHALLVVAALAVEAALAELPFEATAIGEAETPLAVEQAVAEFAFVAVAGGPQPESLAVP